MCVCVYDIHLSSPGPCPQSNRHFQTLKNTFRKPDLLPSSDKQHLTCRTPYIQLFRPAAPNLSDALHPATPQSLCTTQTLNKPLRTELVRGPQQDSALAFLPSGTVWSAINWFSNMFDPVKIGSFCTVGVGVLNFSERVVVLYGVSMV